MELPCFPARSGRARPAIDGNGAVYLGCYDNTSTPSTHSTGRCNRIFPPPATGSAPPRSSSARHFFFGSNDHTVYAYDIGARIPPGRPGPCTCTNSPPAQAGPVTERPSAVTGQTSGTIQVLPAGRSRWTVDAAGKGRSRLPMVLLNGTAIAGATNSTYTVAAAAAGKRRHLHGDGHRTAGVRDVRGHHRGRRPPPARRHDAARKARGVAAGSTATLGRRRHRRGALLPMVLQRRRPHGRHRRDAGDPPDRDPPRREATRSRSATAPAPRPQPRRS